jgi:hypothetical protein
MNTAVCEFEFGSIDELTQIIREHTAGWDTRWYRGTKSPYYSLLPKVLRDSQLQKREGYIAVEFRRRARAKLSGVDTPFEWLCAMQHFGIPTRLLDWSESLAVALFFTTYPIGRDLLAPTIWVLNPFELIDLSAPGDEIIPIAEHLIVTANADIAFNECLEADAKQQTKLPIPVAPDFIFERLSAQNGCFTIHGTETAPLEQCIPDHKRGMLLKLVARIDNLSKIYDSIDLLKPSSDAIFPDVEGLSDYIV